MRLKTTHFTQNFNGKAFLVGLIRRHYIVNLTNLGRLSNASIGYIWSISKGSKINCDKCLQSLRRVIGRNFNPTMSGCLQISRVCLINFRCLSKEVFTAAPF